jgi:hypothetical protein
MALGPGKYDDACAAARIATGARGVFLIVIEGNHGNGFSCQLDSAIAAAVDIPRTLEDIARQIRQSFTNSTNLPLKPRAGGNGESE